MKPVIIINFKNYKEAMGAKGIKLAAYCSTYTNVIVCPQFMELDNINCTGCRVFSQHVDPIVEGAYTGKISILSIKNAGAKGSIINHSENRISFEQIKKTLKLLKKNKMISVVCCETLKEAKNFKKLKPDYIAFEPKKFIGKKVDITKIIDELITKFVKTVSPIPLLIGAGIDSPKMIKRALKLGARGVLIASSVVKSSNPRKIIRELANA